MPVFFKKNLLSEKHPEDNMLPEPHLISTHSVTDEPEPPRKTENHQIEEDFDPLKVLLSWKALSRPFKKRDRSFYTTATILIVLVSLIALLAGEKLLIGALLALAFVVYVLNFIQPEEVEYKLSTQGVTIGDHFYHWNELDSFWINNKEGYPVLSILTHLRFPGVLMLIVNSDIEQEAKKICAKYLPFHEIPPKSILDKWAESLQRHFPLENPHT